MDGIGKENFFIQFFNKNKRLRAKITSNIGQHNDLITKYSDPTPSLRLNLNKNILPKIDHIEFLTTFLFLLRLLLFHIL